MKSIAHTWIIGLTCAAGAAFAGTPADPARVEVTASRIGPPIVAEDACCGIDPFATFGSPLSRGQVSADLVAARASGEYDRLNDEGGANNMPQPIAVVASRADVEADLEAAKASGEYQRLNSEGWSQPAPLRPAASSVAALR